VFGSLHSRKRVDWRVVEAKLEAILDDLDDNQREIVRLRWLEPAERFDCLWRDHRQMYYGFRVPIILGAATVPVLASLSVSKVATALVGLGVAILTGLDSFFRFGLRWQQQRHAAAEIDAEGWQFLELSGSYKKYADHKSAYVDFLGELERMNKQLATTYLDLFREGDASAHKSGSKQQ
jgi:hypothetical protein